MRILIDADGCPVVNIALAVAKEKETAVIIVCDDAHIYNREGASTVTVSKGADSADFVLVNMIVKGDIVITQDYGLAAMCLAKQAKVISQNGMVYDDFNIEPLLLSRHTAKKIRKSGGRLSGNKKRTQQNDIDFEKEILRLISLN
ncbi:MAG: YaiI/YqxD family protein, partial [Christensenellaceae bacterium]